MQVTINLLGQLRHLAACDAVSLEIPDGATVAEAVFALGAEQGAAFLAIVSDEAGALRPSLMVLHNDMPIDKAVPPALRAGDEITLLTAISGG